MNENSTLLSREKARLLVKAIEIALRSGLKHYSVSGRKELNTIDEVLDALVADGDVIIVEPLELRETTGLIQ